MFILKQFHCCIFRHGKLRILWCLQIERTVMPRILTSRRNWEKPWTPGQLTSSIEPSLPHYLWVPRDGGRLWCSAKETSSPNYCPPYPISSSGEGGGIQMTFKGIYSSVPFSKGSRLLRFKTSSLCHPCCLNSSRHFLLLSSHRPIMPP